MIKKLVLLIGIIFLASGATKSPAQPQVAQANEQSHPDVNAADKSPISAVVSPSINAQNRREGDGQQSDDKTYSNRTMEIFGGVITVIATLVVAIATVVVAIFTFKLSDSTKKLWQEAIESGRTARDSANAIRTVASAMSNNVELLRTTVETNREIAARQKLATELQLRAFVFPIGMMQFWEQIPDTKLFGWRFSPTWQNSGNTPTKRLVTHTSGELRDSPLPADFSMLNTTPDAGYGLIPPGIVVSGGQAPGAGRAAVSPQDILDMQSGKKMFFLFGWAKYFDVFEGSPAHITRFCWRVTCVGDPLHFIPDSKDPGEMLRFNYLYNETGNCADEECDEQDT